MEESLQDKILKHSTFKELLNSKERKEALKQAFSKISRELKKPRIT
jgi:hypothetical protein